MPNRRTVVTVVRSYGDDSVSESIINGVVSAEMKRLKDERDFAEWCHANVRRQYVETEFSYDIRPSHGLVRFVEQVVGLAVLLNEERRLNRVSGR